ncbi:hypothetical protein HYH03_016551 [Edaphochlamys debaryana]|uniref:Methyltransferase FkbM domain-containing protein n=1 Tax=Edaphochlamys debaryana TaxID=47281 RepID=A0A836BPT2_9CHLO|nr:hypothetical protein HYH03_016551 [Edaphochlamys debaryana]|eukprot:KAG2484661.1 hypothetical protein HYH03_016551 [Edaphochlamys debaryana]
MNSGYYTMLSASMGARVISFDLQSYCVKLVTELLRQKNAHLVPNVNIINVGLGTPQVVSVPNNTCSGTFGQGGVPKVGGPVAGINTCIMDPNQVLPTWSDKVFTLVKIDTEGAEADILSHLLPLIAAGRIKHLVTELIPHQWPNRGSSMEAGLATLEKVTSYSNRMLLLHDGKPFQFDKKKVTIPFITGGQGNVYEKFSLADLVKDRADQKVGCNLWWTFD